MKSETKPKTRKIGFCEKYTKHLIDKYIDRYKSKSNANKFKHTHFANQPPRQNDCGFNSQIMFQRKEFIG